MTPLLEKFNKLSNLRMDAGRKAALRARLSQFLDAKAAIVQPVRLGWRILLTRRFLVPAGTFALLIVIGGGTSLAAESALPGNPLYIVKLKFNEPAVAALRVSDAAQAEWQAQIATRRLDEADKLAMAHKLNDGAKAEIEANFKQSSAAATAKIAAISAKGDTVAASDISTQFESTLKAHAEILAQIGDGEGNDSNSLKAAVGTAFNTVAKVSGDEEAKTEVKVSANGGQALVISKLSLASKAISDSKDYVSKNSAALGVEATAAASVRLSKADALLSEANFKTASSDWRNAAALAKSALRVAQETRVLAEAQLNANQSVAASAPASEGDHIMSAAKPQLNLLDENGTAAAGLAPIFAVPTSTPGNIHNDTPEQH